MQPAAGVIEFADPPLEEMPNFDQRYHICDNGPARTGRDIFPAGNPPYLDLETRVDDM